MSNPKPSAKKPRRPSRLPTILLASLLLAAVAQAASAQTPGLVVDGATVIQKADAPCADGVNRYVDCGNGTIHDTVTGLLWLQQADCLAPASWGGAMAAALSLSDGGCGLTDGSNPGDWRLPTTEEWQATRSRALALGCTAGGGASPTLTNTPGTACLSVGPSPFTGAIVSPFWSQTTIGASDTLSAWAADLAFGNPPPSTAKTAVIQVWPVRTAKR